MIRKVKTGAYGQQMVPTWHDNGSRYGHVNALPKPLPVQSGTGTPQQPVRRGDDYDGVSLSAMRAYYERVGGHSPTDEQMIAHLNRPAEIAKRRQQEQDTINMRRNHNQWTVSARNSDRLTAYRNAGVHWGETSDPDMIRRQRELDKRVPYVRERDPQDGNYY